MKFLEKFALTVYSYIVLVLAVIMCLLVFNWIDIGTVTKTVTTIAQGDISSKITLVISAIFILLSIKCIFFDSDTEEKIKESQGILLKNENGQLMISKETIDNIVKNAVAGFNNVKDCHTRIDVNSDNQLRITLFLSVYENIVIKELASNLQNKIKEEVKKVSDLDVQEVNVKITSLQEVKKSKE